MGDCKVALAWSRFALFDEGGFQLGLWHEGYSVKRPAGHKQITR